MSNYFNGKGTIGFICDNCGREVNGCSIVNGMKFCAKCYQETFGKDNQQNEIQQLKQQLAEKQNTINEINKEFVQAVHDWKTLCKKKDKEISDLEKKISLMEEQDMIFHNQLAIQELEKVNGILTDTIIEVTQDEFDLNKLCYLEEISARFYEKMQQQIKELKGE